MPDLLARILRAFIDREWPALAAGAILVAATTAWPVYHLGVTAGMGQAVELKDENRVLYAICSEVLHQAQQTAIASVEAQETLKAIQAERAEAVAEAQGWEVDR